MGRPAPQAAPLSAQELAAFDGTYEVTRGGQLAGHADGDGLALEADDKLLIALEAGGASKKLDNDAKLAARAKKIVQLLDAGDAVAAQALLTDKWPGWNEQMVKVWSQ